MKSAVQFDHAVRFLKANNQQKKLNSAAVFMRAVDEKWVSFREISSEKILKQIKIKTHTYTQKSENSEPCFNYVETTGGRKISLQVA